AFPGALCSRYELWVFAGYKGGKFCILNLWEIPCFIDSLFPIVTTCDKSCPHGSVLPRSYSEHPGIHAFISWSPFILHKFVDRTGRFVMIWVFAGFSDNKLFCMDIIGLGALPPDPIVSD